MPRLSVLFLCFPLALIGLAISVPAQAQLTPHQAVADMGRGINLGNTLEPPREGAWNNGPAQEAYFDAYKDAGFATVRVPVRWDEHTTSTPPYTIAESWLDRVEQVVDWGLERDFYIILNAHHEDWLKQTYSDPAIRARFDSIWVQVAERFKGKSEKLLFEIINEPFGMTRTEVDDLNARILSIIRKENPTRLVIFSGNQYSNIPELLAAAIPDPDDPYLVGYFHSYDPWSFAGLGEGKWGSTAERAIVRQRFSQVAQWSDSNNIPVIISEFGAVKRADETSRQVFFATYVEEALRAGFAFQVWDDGGISGSATGADFQVMDRANLTWPEELDLLIHAYPDGPTDLRATSGTGITLTWTMRSNADSMHVERRGLSGTYAAIGHLAGNDSSFTDTTAVGGQTYLYRVVAETPTRPVAYSYPVEATARVGRRTPFGGTPTPIPGILQAEDFDDGGQDFTYFDSTPTNTGSAYRTNVAVDIEARDDGGFQITDVAGGEWLEYSIDVAETGTYEAVIYVATELGGGRLRLSVGELQGELLRTTTTGDGQTLAPIVTTLPLEAGTQILRLNLLTVRPYNVDRIEFTLAGGTAAEPGVSDQTFRMYPNPASEYVVVELGSERGAGSLEVLNVLGQLVRTVDLNASSPTARIPIGDLASGTYVVRAVVGPEVVGREVFIKP